MADSMPKLLQICEDGAWSQKWEPPQRPCPKFDFDKTGSLSTSQGVLGDKARAKIVYFRTTTYKASAIDGLCVSSWRSSGGGRGKCTAAELCLSKRVRILPAAVSSSTNAPAAVKQWWSAAKSENYGDPCVRARCRL